MTPRAGNSSSRNQSGHVARRSAYTAAGVDVEAGDRAVELMRTAVESTRRPEVIGGLGGFAAAVAVPAGYRDPVLVSSTDGVGTKTAIASALARFDSIGRDLVAMCADDVVCSGATPLFFLDYVAVGRLDPVGIAELVEGVAAGCVAAGCALVGGETAEHPGLLDPGSFDIGSSTRASRGQATRSSGLPRTGSTRTATRSSGRSSSSGSSTCTGPTRSSSSCRSGTRRRTAPSQPSRPTRSRRSARCC
jgi:phosphoribosylformylglycinamidine cyclo-ligase